jgi:hypothetical protein
MVIIVRCFDLIRFLFSSSSFLVLLLFLKVQNPSSHFSICFLLFNSTTNSNHKRSFQYHKMAPFLKTIAATTAATAAAFLASPSLSVSAIEFSPDDPTPYFASLSYTPVPTTPKNTALLLKTLALPELRSYQYYFFYTFCLQEMKSVSKALVPQDEESVSYKFVFDGCYSDALAGQKCPRDKFKCEWSTEITLNMFHTPRNGTVRYGTLAFPEM